MTRQLTPHDLARRDAQDLHKKISANIAHAEKATWADVQVVQSDASRLAAKMKPLLDGHSDTTKADLTSAIAKLDAAAKQGQDKAADAKDQAKHANSALLASSHVAAQSLSHAIAELRSKSAKVIEPKKVPA